MAAYYNEIDPKAAAWLRGLITAGLIAEGEVDERSIADVRPDDLREFVQCHFFAGIGGWSYALRLAGWPDDRAVWTGSCPCQPFSAAGSGAGFADERHLWPAWYWLIDQHRPVVIFGEQVESPAARAWLDLVSTDLEGIGYACGPSDLPVAGVGAPGVRQRLFWVADTAGEQRGARRIGAESDQSGSLERSARLREAGRMADISSGGLGIDRPRDTGHVDQLGASLGLVNTGLLPGCSEHGNQPRSESRRGEAASIGCGSGPASETLGLVDSLVTRLEGHAGDGRERFESRRLDPDAARSVAATGATGGAWADADWLYCRDHAFRPVESGTFPLAHGVPARVGRLRGYGNAINPYIAAAFIEAYCEARVIALAVDVPTGENEKTYAR